MRGRPHSNFWDLPRIFFFFFLSAERENLDKEEVISIKLK